MKRITTALLAAIGVHKALSAEQKHDIAVAAIQVAPGAVAAGGAQVVAPENAAQIFGAHMNQILLFASIFFILLQCGHLIWKWRRDARRDHERQEDRRNNVRRTTPDSDLCPLGDGE